MGDVAKALSMKREVEIVANSSYIKRAEPWLWKGSFMCSKRRTPRYAEAR